MNHNRQDPQSVASFISLTFLSETDTVHELYTIAAHVQIFVSGKTNLTEPDITYDDAALDRDSSIKQDPGKRERCNMPLLPSSYPCLFLSSRILLGPPILNLVMVRCKSNGKLPLWRNDRNHATSGSLRSLSERKGRFYSLNVFPNWLTTWKIEYWMAKLIGNLTIIVILMLSYSYILQYILLQTLFSWFIYIYIYIYIYFVKYYWKVRDVRPRMIEQNIQLSTDHVILKSVRWIFLNYAKLFYISPKGRIRSLSKLYSCKSNLSHVNNIFLYI